MRFFILLSSFIFSSVSISQSRKQQISVMEKSIDSMVTVNFKMNNALENSAKEIQQLENTVFSAEQEIAFLNYEDSIVIWKTCVIEDELYLTQYRNLNQLIDMESSCTFKLSTLENSAKEKVIRKPSFYLDTLFLNKLPLNTSSTLKNKKKKLNYLSEIFAEFHKTITAKQDYFDKVKGNENSLRISEVRLQRWIDKINEEIDGKKKILENNVAKYKVQIELNDSLGKLKKAKENSRALCIMKEPKIYIEDNFCCEELTFEQKLAHLFNSRLDKYLEENPDEFPEFPGGLGALKKFVKENIKYPAVAFENGIQGTVYVRFEVSALGEISNVKVIKAIEDCPECSHEAIRILKLMPNWIPAKNHGKMVRSRFTTNIKFQLV